MGYVRKTGGGAYYRSGSRYAYAGAYEPRFPATPELLYSAPGLRNTSAFATLPGQPHEEGFYFRRGKVPNSNGQHEGTAWKVEVRLGGVRAGNLVRPTFHKDGSLRFVSWKVRLDIPAGGNLPVTIWKVPGSWSEETTPLHTSPQLCLGGSEISWIFQSWKGRPTTTTTTAELGPYTANLSEVMANDNSAWISRRYASPLCTEWVASRGVKRQDNTYHPDFMTQWYMQAWGGTQANKPDYLRVVGRTVYGWDDASVLADHQAFRTSMDLRTGSQATLEWAAPTLVNPTIINLETVRTTDPTRKTWSFSATTDVFVDGTTLTQPWRHDRLQITGGRNIHIRGGLFKPDNFTSAVGTVNITKNWGTCFIEGVHIDHSDLPGTQAKDGIGYYAHADAVLGNGVGDFVLQNSRIDNIRGSFSGTHGDCFQPQGSINHVMMFNVNMTTSYTALQLEPRNHLELTINKVTLKRVAARKLAIDDAHAWLYYFTQTGTPVYPQGLWMEDVYTSETADRLAGEWWTYPPSTSPQGAVRSGNRISWPNKPYNGYITVGTPEFVTAQEIGLNYTGAVAGTQLVRGTTAGTAGWTNVDSFIGGMLATFGPSALPDIYDVHAGGFVEPAKVVLVHDMAAYAELSRVIPRLDLTNTTSPWWNESFRNSQSYTPGTKTYFDPNMGATGGRDEICWGVYGGEARATIAHAQRSPGALELLEQTLRVQACAIGSLPAGVKRRATRTQINYLPPAFSRVTETHPPIYNGTRFLVSAGFTRWSNYDSSHIPGFGWWAALRTGSEFYRDLLYHEMQFPATACLAADGFYTTKNGVQVGGVSVYSQTRSFGAAIRAVAAAYSLGHPDDLDHRLADNLLDMALVAQQQLAPSEDAWRGGNRFVTDNLWILQENDGGYKPWMHCISGSGAAAAHGMVEEPRTEAVADYFTRVPTVLAGGYNGVEGAPFQYQIGRFFKRPEAYTLNIHMNEGGSGVGRQPWQFNQWGFAENFSYGADGKTITASGAAVVADGMYFTPRGPTTPTGLTRGQLYYIRDTSGQNFKVSATLGGPVVTFATTAPTGVQGILTGPPGTNEVEVGYDPNSGSAEGYAKQVLAYLKGYLWWVKDDSRVRQAAQNMETIILGAPTQTYIEQAKWVNLEDL